MYIILMYVSSYICVFLQLKKYCFQIQNQHGEKKIGLRTTDKTFNDVYTLEANPIFDKLKYK